MGPGGGGFTPAAFCLFLGDDAALPAIGRCLEALPAVSRALALIEVDGPEDEQGFATTAAVEIRWLYRRGAAPGTTGLLFDALRAVEFPPGEADIQVWAGLEYEAFRRIRHYLRETRGVPKGRQLVVSYWRRGAEQKSLAAAAVNLGRRLFGG
ncbi:siderophore-interacting protein [Zavarzinia compransoris]|uniref:siderophore-interacting protein n=1 Tax=Zavarzinia compransoris TaxID=1264899 RepID=UPI0024433EE1|nr:siderophore-interacting protein [Zavarzinia compransoris]